MNMEKSTREDHRRERFSNSVGAGDSMVAGFVTGYLNTGDYEKAFELELQLEVPAHLSIGWQKKKM